MTVFLVGAGPGDPGLLTVRAVELIASADVILYDRLIPVTALDGAREAAELVYVGKIGGGKTMPQQEIDRLLLEHGRRGGRVVRLKGGDPFVFGRGGEEAVLLREAGIAFEVVPGVTSGVAAPAYAGIPVTFRGDASAVAMVTGHTQSTASTGTGEDPAKPETAIDWPALAAFPGTLVFYMGVRQLKRISAELIAGGRPASEPVGVIERGTMPGQRTVVGTLADIADRAAAASVRAPAITVVGAVARLADEIGWLEHRPLHGRVIAVTRARAQASALAARLRDLGAEVIEAPAIRTRSLTADVPALDGFDTLCVTSPNGADELFARLIASGRDGRALAGLRVAAVGPGTARALAAHGILADVIPERSVAEGLLEALEAFAVKRVLVARASEARALLVDALRERGAEVVELALYETLPEPLDPATRDAALGADHITFTSASSVRYFLEAAGDAAADGLGRRVVSIGPATSAALRDRGIDPALEADPHTPDGLVDALLAAAVAAATEEPSEGRLLPDPAANPGAAVDLGA